MNRVKKKSRGRIFGTAFGILMTAFLLVGCAAARPAGIEVYKGREVAPNEVLVKFRGTAAPQAMSQAVTGENVDETEYLGHIQAMRFHSRSKDVDTLIRELSARSDVEYVEPNYVVHAMDTIPNDPYFGQNLLYGLSKISAPAAWDVSTGSPVNVVAVVDTGIDYTHGDLATNVWSAPRDFTVTIGSTIMCPAGSHGFNAILRTCDPLDDNNHGTHVSGTIGAVGNNNLGVVGVNWNTRIMGAKFLDASGSGYTSDAVNAIEFAIQAKQAFADINGANVRVLSNSWGGGGADTSLLNEINRANDNGMLFVAAAGNSKSNNDVAPNYPSNYDAPNVVAVAATDSNDLLASFSNWGPTTVDLGAPGVGVYSTIRNNNYASFSGTSMATPHVSGAAALILSRCALDTAGLKADILNINNVDPIASLAGKTVTGGRLNVNKAIRACTASTTPTTVTITTDKPSSTCGDPVTFTATVTPSGGLITPSGMVTFFDGASAFGAGTLSGGTASFMTSSLPGGVHSITAIYSGDSSFGGSTSQPLLYTVSQAQTTTTLTSTLTTSTFGQSVTFTAKVDAQSGSGTPAGTVTFFDDSTKLGTVTLSSGSASFSTSTLAVGVRTITATYNGNSNYAASTSDPVSLTVSQAASTTRLTSSPNPSTVGQSVTFTATVTPAGATGTVTFSEGNTQLGTGTLSGGKATWSTSGLSVGDHTITASYPGDSNVAGSSAQITQKVNSAPPQDFSLTASPTSWSIYRGFSTSYKITVTRLSGFTGSVSLSFSSPSSTITGSFSPNPVTNTRSTLTVRTRTSTPRDTYTLTITGTSGSSSHTITVTLTVR